MDLMFFLNSILFGVGLAMDAFSVSLANGLREPEMPYRRMCLIAGTFCLFQILMPLIGWFCVHTIAETFLSVQKYIPWIALILLLYIGGKMLIEGIRDRKGSEVTQTDADGEADSRSANLGAGSLILQGIATSIDALSVGFTIAEYDVVMASTEALIIGVVTFVICMAGVRLGKRFGTRLAGKATILGGVILIFIGLEIWLKGVL